VVHGWISTYDVAKELETCGTDDVREWWLVSTSVDLFIRNPVAPGNCQVYKSFTYLLTYVSAPQRMTARMKTRYSRSFVAREMEE